MSEWKTIDSAPRAKNVLLYRRDAGEPFIGCFGYASIFIEDGDAEVEQWWTADGQDLSGCMTPTHWQPLPPPPPEGSGHG